MRPRCLIDALALDRILLSRKMRAMLVFGVRLNPFGAHCWLQTTDAILRQDRSRGAQFPSDHGGGMTRGLLAFMGAPARAGELAAAAGMAGLCESAAPPGFRIFTGADLTVRTLPGGAITIGDMFPRTGTTCDVPSEGWGNYLAFSSRGGVRHVERAPLTGMTLFWTRTEGEYSAPRITSC